MENFMTRAEVDQATNEPATGQYPYIRPKDAATLILIDGEPGTHRILLGRRHMRHKFMPGLFVFPGGRIDQSDGSVPAPDGLHPEIESRIMARMKGRPTSRRARALALGAIRETYEEAGLFVGIKDRFETELAGWQEFVTRGNAPAIGKLRVVARAITPPGRPRRFDTWFFAAFADQICDRLAEGTGPSGELEDLHWLTFEETNSLKLPQITKIIINELDERLKTDPQLNAATRVPFYYLKGNSFCRELL